MKRGVIESLACAVRWLATGWVGRLFCEDQFFVAGDLKAIFIPAKVDADFAATGKQLRGIIGDSARGAGIGFFL